MQIIDLTDEGKQKLREQLKLERLLTGGLVDGSVGIRERYPEWMFVVRQVAMGLTSEALPTLPATQQVDVVRVAEATVMSLLSMMEVVDE